MLILNWKKQKEIIVLYLIKQGVITIKDEQGFVILFVLIILLLTGLMSSSLMKNSLVNLKIVNNYITRKKAEFTAQSGLKILEYLKKEEINLDYPLDLKIGRDYNIRINIDSVDNYEEKINFKCIGYYLDNSKVIYHSYKKE